MPKYRVISEVDTGAEHREPRGARLRLDEEKVVTVVEARTLPEAALHAYGSIAEEENHVDRRIISVEEIHPGFSYTGVEITHALTRPEGDWTDEPMLDPKDYAEDEKIYGGGDFIYTVDRVATALRESGFVPGLDISLLQGGDGYVDYSMIEVHDDARMIYLSRGCELKNLTDDRSATGWDGVLAIARQLISLSDDLH